MSETKNFSGISYKIPELVGASEEIIKDYIQKYKPKEYVEYLKSQENKYPMSLNEITSIYDVKLKEWTLISDIKGVYGLIYLMQDEEACDDMDFNLYLYELDLHIDDLKMLLLGTTGDEVYSKEYIKMFATIYYDGSDNPFTF